MTWTTRRQGHYPWSASRRGDRFMRSVSQFAENLQIGDQGIEFGEYPWPSVKCPNVRGRTVPFRDPFGVGRIGRCLSVGIGTRIGDHFVGIGHADLAQRRQMRAEVVTPKFRSP